jgi:hypothetical protein
MDITDHYELLESDDGDIIHQSLERARRTADDNPDRIWFVRHSDTDCQCGADWEEGIECDCEPDWDVELYRGQFVNNVGFLVTTEPCRPEHRDEIFTY